MIPLIIFRVWNMMSINTRKVENTFAFPLDPTGKSTNRYVQFIFNSGDVIMVSCYKYEKSIKIKNNWADNLSVEIKKKEQRDWMKNHIN